MNLKKGLADGFFIGIYENHGRWTVNFIDKGMCKSINCLDTSPLII